jgi:two-component system, LytTR family, sensor kinase
MNRFFRYRIDHVLFWVLTIGFHAFTSWPLTYTLSFDQYLNEVIVRNVLLALLIYGNLLVIFPLFNSRKIFLGSCLTILSLALYASLKWLHEYVYFVNIFDDHLMLRDASAFFPFWNAVYYQVSIALFYLSFAIALHLSKQWYLQRETLRQIQLEKLNTELDYLKAQMNPHFLFNSINTIFFQINKENTEARETLGKFSDMLRYQLYECNGNEIAIEKELAYLKNYVELQKLRRNANDTVEFSVSDSLKNFSLPPLLLIPFIENAFKHVSNFTDRKNEVQISLGKDGLALSLHVVNTTDHQPSDEPGGIGLKNVTRRLELLYPNRHTLVIQQTTDRFDVHLTLELL